MQEARCRIPSCFLHPLRQRHRVLGDPVGRGYAHRVHRGVDQDGRPERLALFIEQGEYAPQEKKSMFSAATWTESKT